MRHRRDGLKPETFPFLAVLLCALGALILLLLVMDRRAKAVARAKAAAAAQALIDQTDEEEAERRRLRDAELEEWERRRQALHDDLMHQIEDLQGRIQSVGDQMSQAEADMQQREALNAQLRQRIQSQHTQNRLEDEAAATRRREAERQAVLAAEKARADAQARSEAAKAEQDRLTAELRLLEQTLAELKVARQQRQQTYALIPYRGKHGDTRPPLYVECRSRGLLFHPDRRDVGFDSEPAVLAEVERRVAEKRQPGQLPYILFLIRPDGIASYYHALAVLKEVKVDYGYEMVDADWVLEFPDKIPDDLVAVTPETPREAKRGPGGRGISGPAPAGGGGFVGGNPVGPSSARLPGGSEKPGDGGAFVGSTPVTPGSSRPPGGGNPGEVASGGAAPRPVNSGTKKSTGSPGGGVTGGPVGEAASPGHASGAGHPGEPAASDTQPQSGNSGTVPPDPPRKSTAPPPVKPGIPQPSFGMPRPPSAPSGLSQGSSPSGGSDVGLQFPGGESSPPQAPPLPSREWSISVECLSDGVIVYPGEQRFKTTALSTPQGIASLVESIRNLAQRRQATVRPGEPGYRVVIRFEVRPDGLRSYYVAYPALDVLRLPMTRHNLDADEEIRE